MLTPADRAIVAQDPRLPGLGLLLDATACAELVGEHLGEPVQLHPRYLRYKPGTSCVLAVRVRSTAGDQPFIVISYAADGAHKLRKSAERAPAGSVLVADPVRGLLVATAAADRDLPGVAPLHDERSEPLLRRLLAGHGEAIDGLRLRTIRHNPQRRWVGLLGGPSGPLAVLRCYRPGRLRQPLDAVAALRARALGTPALLGSHERLGVAAIGFVPGRTLLAGGCAEDRADGIDHASAGAVLAQLHAQSGVELRPTGATEDACAVRKSARQIGRLLPGTAEQVSALAEQVADRLRGARPYRPIHGDFSTDQVVISADGRANLIDLDSARLGEPAADLACASAALSRDVVLGRCSQSDRTTALRSLIAGYVGAGGDVDPDRLAAYEAGYLLRRAVEPFRLRATPDWPAAAEWLIGRSAAVLSAGSSMTALR